MRILFTAIALSCLAPAMGRGQVVDNWEARRVTATRPMLEDLLRRLELAAESPAYSAELRGQSRLEAAAVRTRLAEGDFRGGERILLSVEGEVVLSDTFLVEPDGRLALPVVGDVSLRGVLRAELEPHLRQVLGRFLREPVLHARSLIPISILGEVVRPGFYTLPAEIPLTDVLMTAGGPTHDARVTSLRIDRGDRELWGGAALQNALGAGRTVAELGMQAGDRVWVPRRKSGLNESSLRAVTLLLSIPAVVYGLTRVF